MPTLVHSIYRSLLAEIAGIYTTANLEAKKSLTRILTAGYWEIGKRIVTVQQDSQLRAQYGENLLERLSNDLTKTHGEGFSLTNIKNMRRFYLSSPKRQPVALLEWSKHCVLLRIKDTQKRKQLAHQAIKENWTRNELVKHLKERHFISAKRPKKDESRSEGRLALAPLLSLKRGQLYTYRLKPIGSSWEVDCGFKITRAVSLSGIKNKNGNTIIACEKINDTFKCSASSAGAKGLYTYKAAVIRVVDGDTLVARIDCGFNTKIEQILRLRGINAPEVRTVAGAKAKRFVTRKLKKGAQIIVRTSSPDKFGRYLADVFYTEAGRESFLNQELLDYGHAEVY